MKKEHIFTWGTVLARFFSIQLVVQAATAAAGIAIVRMLTKENYAFYSIAISFITTASALSDCGVGVALSALGGKVWQDNEALGSLVASAMSIRRWLVGFVVLAVGIVVPILLRRDGAGFGASLSVTAVLSISLVFQIGVGIYGIVPQLRANYGLLQSAAVISVAIRLALLGLFYFSYLDATLALLTNCVAIGVQLWLYVRYVNRAVNLRKGPDKQTVSQIFAIIRKQVPYELYGAVSGQMSVLLISVFGNSGRVADVGALGRLAMIFTAMSGVLSNVLLPRFARCQDPKQLRPLFGKILILYSSVVSSVLLIGWLLPNQLVSLLGHSYASLGSECLLALSGSVIGSIGMAVWGLNICRGWIVPARIGVTAGIVAQICGVMLFDIKTVHGVLLMSLLTNCAGLILHLIASGYFFRISERDFLRSPA